MTILAQTTKISRRFSLLFCALFALPAGLQARHRDFAVHPIFVSATAGAFRISAEHFSHYYSSPWGFLPGLQLGWGLSPSAFLVMKGAYFNKTGQKNSTWKQRQLEFGFRRYSVGFSASSRTYMGFGLAFFQIKENSGQFLRELGKNTTKVWPQGFFIELGFEQTLTSHLFFSLNFDISTAGMYGSSSLERQSLGGFSASSGLKYQIF